MQTAIKLATTLAILALLTTLFGAAPARAAGASVQGVANVNNASVAQLKLLPGVGKAKAQAIVEQRKNAPYRAVDDLVKVKGIGKRLLQKIRAHVTVEGKTTIKPSATKKNKSRKSSK